MLTGHPKGLYRLFFIEMWERLAFYTMVGILMLYTIDTDTGGLGLPKVVGNEIYGLYLAFVYFTPYIGGLLADRFLGYRRSVLIGGLFFALGFFLMGIYSRTTFVSGLVCLCIGNGFFKPNISVMVGNLYEKGDPKRDAGFNIFYMGINIGAFFANFIAAFVRNEWGWLWIFRTAGFGMFIGIAVLLWSWKALEKADRQPERGPDDTGFGDIILKILGPAILAGIAGYFGAKNLLPAEVQELVRPAICGFLAGMIPIVFFFGKLAFTANEEEKPGLMALLPVYIAGGTFFMVLHLNGSAMTAWAKENTDRQLAAPERFREEAMPSYYSNAGEDEPRPSELSLLAVDSEEIASMFGQKRMNEASLTTIAATLDPATRIETLWVKGEAVELTGQKKEWDRFGTDVYSEVKVEETTDSHGATEITVTPAEGAERLKRVAFVRTLEGESTIPLFVVTSSTFESLYSGYEEKYGHPPEKLPPGRYMKIANSELFQSLNALFVIALTPLIVMFFQWLLNRGRDFSTARKIFTGMVLTSLSLLVMALAGYVGDNGAMKVSWLWLVGFYFIVTVGELCLSPMALSLVTKLSPKRLVGLTMGGWFLATAFGNNFSGFFGGLQSKMDPAPFFLLLAGIAGAVALFILMLLPKLDAAIKKYGA